MILIVLHLLTPEQRRYIINVAQFHNGGEYYDEHQFSNLYNIMRNDKIDTYPHVEYSVLIIGTNQQMMDKLSVQIYNWMFVSETHSIVLDEVFSLGEFEDAIMELA